MGYKYTTFFLVAFIFLISACSDFKTPTGQIIKEATTEYEAKEETILCSDECSTDTCDNFNYISCISEHDGCQYTQNKGFVKGKCGIECIQDSDCGIAQKCESYKCKCSDTCLTDSCSGFEFISCESKLDECKSPINRGVVKGKCNVGCIGNSGCIQDYECNNYKCIKKIEKTSTESAGVLESLKELQSKLKEQQSINAKVDECVRLCSGEEYDIPYVKDTFWSTCYEVYYYAGEEALNEMISDC